MVITQSISFHHRRLEPGCGLSRFILREWHFRSALLRRSQRAQPGDILVSVHVAGPRTTAPEHNHSMSSLISRCLWKVEKWQTDVVKQSYSRFKDQTRVIVKQIWDWTVKFTGLTFSKLIKYTIPQIQKTHVVTCPLTTLWKNNYWITETTFQTYWWFQKHMFTLQSPIYNNFCWEEADV